MASLNDALRTFKRIMVQPRLEPDIVPKTSRYCFYEGIKGAGVIPFGSSMVDFYYTSAPPQSLVAMGQAYPSYGTNQVFSGKSPNRGIYTGVKHG